MCNGITVDKGLCAKTWEFGLVDDVKLFDGVGATGEGEVVEFGDGVRDVRVVSFFELSEVSGEVSAGGGEIAGFDRGVGIAEVLGDEGLLFGMGRLAGGEDQQ